MHSSTSANLKVNVIAGAIALLLSVFCLAIPAALADDATNADSGTTTELAAGDSSAVSTDGTQTDTDGQTATNVETPAEPKPVSVTYRVNLKGGGWTSYVSNNAIAGTTSGSKRVKNLQMKIDTGDYADSGIRFRARLATGSWTAWKTNAKKVGNHNNIEAFQIELTGSIAEDYDVVYRAYVDSVGWQRRMRNGEVAGTTGRGLIIKALKVTLVKKTARAGWIYDDGDWSWYKNGKQVKSKWVSTSESPIDEALKSKHKYWLDANGDLAVERLINPANARDKKAGFLGYARGDGYLATSKYAGPNGLMLIDKKGNVCTKTGWLTTKTYDGKSQRYRLKKSGACSVVQTGLFKVGKKKYYGWEDERGYVMRSKTWYVANCWYKANSKGVLKNVNSKTKSHIERYVKWAIKIANDDSHGYSQAVRFGPDYDCSSLVVSALRAAGFPESGALWTGNMKKCLKSIGFKWHKGTKGLKRGDIMLVHASYRQHTEIYIGKGKLVGAHSSETGGIYGRAGDQTGNEISVGKYYNAPWQGYLRYRS